MKRGATSIVAAFCALSAAPAGATWRCTCKDVPAIQDYLNVLGSTRKAWEQVLREVETGASTAPKTPADAPARFRKIMGWTSGKKVGHLDPTTGEPVVDPEFERTHCTVLVKSVGKHEWAHTFYFARRWPTIVSTDDQRELTAILARSEIHARNKEEAYLREELEDLDKDCSWKCKCTQEWFPTSQECAAACPKPSMACNSPTCCQWDRKSGKRERCL